MLGIIFFLLVAAILLMQTWHISIPKVVHLSFRDNAAKRKRIYIIAENALNPLEKTMVKVDSLLKKIHKSWNYFYKVVAVFFLAGCMCGIGIFRDVTLSLFAGAAFMPLAYLFLLFRTMSARRRELEELESVMSIITNAYLTSDDIIGAFQVYVEEKNRYVDERFREINPFDEFLTDVLLINPNVERALILLDGKIDNRHFHEWINKLLLCMKDRRMKFNLQSTLRAMNDQKNIQQESDTAMMTAWRNYLMTIAAMFSVIPILKFVNVQWFLTLTQTVIGKGFVIAMILTSLLTAAYVMKINRPIE